MTQIFLSHNHHDKPLVEPIAIRLAEIFGQESVFYDSWSMKPGDGIIDKMNEGMEAPDYVFFFVSEKSLKSPMVKLEWQTALLKATSGACKLIPVRVDGSPMPPLLMQTVYIDMHSHGIEAALHQIVGLVQGTGSFAPQQGKFQNLSFEVSGDPKTELLIEISASHLLEPNPEFILLLQNEENDQKLVVGNGVPIRSGFNTDLDLGGLKANGLGFAPLGGAVTPTRPLVCTLAATGSKPIQFVSVVHRSTNEYFENIPQKNWRFAPNAPLLRKLGIGDQAQQFYDSIGAGAPITVRNRVI